MDVFEDILSYYPISQVSDQSSYQDFIILSLEELTQNLTEEHLSKYSKLHLRDFFEISIGVNESNAPSIEVGTDKIVTQDNNVVFVSPMQAFSIDFGSLGSLQMDRGYLLAFKPSFLVSNKRSFEIIHIFRFFNSYTFPQYVLTSEQLQPMISIFKNIYQEFTGNTSYAREIIKGYLEVLLHSFNRILKLNPTLVTTSTCEHIATRFEQKIIEDEHKISTIRDYASQLNISPNYLSECVKKVTGKNAKQVLLSHKLIVAKGLLQQHEKSIAEIAYEMEFTEPTNFTKFFKKMAGITPHQFRVSNAL
ncbi:hypothetical protein BKI52_09110 [marine bacterium AO1-C]|nr:hypothetical protein BKI52_09110 [marine bacterium AO1-C]